HQSAQIGGYWFWRQRYFVSARYLFDRRTSWTQLPQLTYAPFIPVQGNFAGPAVALTLDKTQWYRWSISPQKGYSLTGTFEAKEPFFGSDYRKEIGTVDGRWYVPVPLVPFGVIGVRGIAGYAVGDAIRPSTFRVGGAIGE